MLRVCEPVGVEQESIPVEFDDDLIAALDEMATRRGRSRSDLIAEAVERFLNDPVEPW